jgi:replicative DNA helicase
VDGNNIEQFRREQMRKKLDNSKSMLNSGFYSIDKLMPMGFVKPGLSVVGAIPKCGKTTFARNVLVNLCNAGHSVVLWSGEMQSAREIDWIASVAMGEPFEHFHSAEKIVHPDFVAKVKQFDARWRQSWKLRIFDDLPILSGEFFSKIAILDGEQKIDIVIIDMMDFFSDVVLENDPGRRSYVMGSILLRAVAFAKKHGVHIMCLWQWDMPEKKNKSKINRPTLMDFRLSRSAVEKADQILLLHRPKLFDKEIVDDYTEVIVSVQRGTTKGGVAELYLEHGLRLIDGKQPQESEPLPF